MTDELARVRVADSWPVIHNWAHGGTVLAPELIRECRDVISYLGGGEVMREALDKIRLYGSPFWDEDWGTPAKIANDALAAKTRREPMGENTLEPDLPHFPPVERDDGPDPVQEELLTPEELNYLLGRLDEPDQALARKLRALTQDEN
jgi:hypothetical protein